jgi:hypothetical protein
VRDGWDIRWFVAGCGRTTAEADPRGMRTKKNRQQPKRTGNDKKEQATTKTKCGGSSPFDFAQGQNET